MNKIPKPIKPLPGQESVWDYPRPPRMEAVKQRLRIVFAGVTIADTTRSYRILETSHPPVYYIPLDDIKTSYITKADGGSFCEFKGAAVYWSIVVNDKSSPQAAWSYPNPTAAYHAIKDHLAFYASRVDECWVGEEKVQPQSGDFYGGWITSNIVGPFKGEPGTRFW
ncbi:MAG: DUF427 domain-containing protein [Pseudomonadota bacterium]